MAVRKIMKTYDLIYKLLKENPRLRDSDRLLMWRIWEMTGAVKNGVMTQEGFMNAEHFETIRRTRQKVQEDHEELKSSPLIQAYKDDKQSTKGTFVYREQVNMNKYIEEYKQAMNAPEPVINEQPSLL